MSRHAPAGLLLLNTGTPDAPDPRSVRRYLHEFLSDPRVIDLSPAARWLLLHLVILPFRPRRSAHAYRRIWTPQGSPLLVNFLSLANSVRTRLGDSWRVEVGMGYGRPTIASALEKLAAAGALRIVAMPMFPQYATSSAGSVMAAAMRAAAEPWVTLPLTVTGSFHDDEGFLAAEEAAARPAVEAAPDHLLFSFHGLPERHLRKADPAGYCLSSPDCCERRGAGPHHCYRAQCFETARLLADRLGLAQGSWSVSFQSRLGRTPWIGPHTDATVRALATSGVKRLAVACPSFVADCLETLEEIGLRARDDFLAHGGKEFTLIPSLNAHPAWADAVAVMARRAAG